MATVVNRSQQVVTGGLRPAPAYSRVVAIRADVAPEAEAETHQYTDTFGQILRLLRIDVWLFAKGLTNVADGWFTLMTGQEEPPTPLAMLTNWDVIIPNHHGDVNAFEWQGNRVHFGWDMIVLYKTVPRRFGIVLHNYIPEFEFSAIATFTVSEG